MTMIPRPEHPFPQFRREKWMNLNGSWEFEIDNGSSGRERGLQKGQSLQGRITVPFCPESRLSGVHNTDFMNSVWYRRSFTLSSDWLAGRTLLHFGAVDYHAFVYVNAVLAGEHIGGYSSFCLDISQLIMDGENFITVCADDDVRDPMQPRGKQSEEYFSHGCDYTRTTGIWQTVWLENVPATYIKGIKYYPDIEGASLHLAVEVVGGAEFSATAFLDGKPVGSITQKCTSGSFRVTLPLDVLRLWQPGEGALYDLALTYGSDSVQSYFGMREVRLDGYRFLLNGKSVFQRLVLDQGFYPDGIYTAPSDEELAADIERSMAMGFNGARLHQKVFEPRFLYHCDRLGYLVWGEYGNWGADHTDIAILPNVLSEWCAIVTRDFNHPAIIGWCPFNETWDMHGAQQDNRILSTVYHTTKLLDDTRPCIDTSGNYHVATDIFDTHDYEQDPAVFKANNDRLLTENKLYDRLSDRQTYTGEATFVSEYGGIHWSESGGWGYGVAPKNGEEFIARFRGLTDALLDNRCMMGLCYTQLTDVEQEQNGLYTYDRRPKFPPEIFKAILSRKAAIEG